MRQGRKLFEEPPLAKKIAQRLKVFCGVRAKIGWHERQAVRKVNAPRSSADRRPRFTPKALPTRFAERNNSAPTACAEHD